jgi:hypothetical protein
LGYKFEEDLAYFLLKPTDFYYSYKVIPSVRARSNFSVIKTFFSALSLSSIDAGFIYKPRFLLKACLA